MEENILDRALYKQIKNMNRDEMEGFLRMGIRVMNEKTAEGSSVDLYKMREKIW